MKRENKSCENTTFDHFKEIVREIVSVPKSEIDKRQAEYEKNKRKNENKNLVKP